VEGSIRVLIVDDDERFLDALEAFVARDRRFQVVGRAADGQEALTRAAELAPDVVTMDVEMPVMDGVEATRLISAYFRIPVVLVAGGEASERVREALAAGAVSHVAKARVSEELIPALLAAASSAAR
jgi:CheY-like chemotaxis protein